MKDEYFSAAQFLTAFTSPLRVHGQLVRLFARGIEDQAAVHNCSEEAEKCETTYYTNSFT